MELRWYQNESIDAVWNYFSSGKTGNPVIALPTGTGKSVVIGELVRRIFAYYPTQRVLKLTHVKELIGQNFEKLLHLWPLAPAGIYSAGLNRRDVGHPITYAGIASVVNRPNIFGHIDLVLIDECHLVSSKEGTSYQKFITALKLQNPKLKVIGFSATPYRMGTGLLTDEGSIFTDICYDITGLGPFNRLVAEGFLAPLIPRQTSQTIDTSGVGLVGGEYNQGELQEIVDVDETTVQACEEMMEQGKDRHHWVVFAAGVQHAEHVATQLRRMGVDAHAVHSKISDERRDELVAGFKAGKIRCLVNNNVLTTGFDLPTLDMIGMLRPTNSPGLWVQMLGRGTRPSPGKENCLVLDFAGNTKRLGPINDPVMPKPKGKGPKGHAPVKLCEVCDTWNHARATHCISCGAEFKVDLAIEARASELEVMAFENSLPKVEEFDVDVVYFEKSSLRDGSPALKARYFCGLRQFTEWICIGRSGFAGKRARDWWRLRMTGRHAAQEPPDNVDDACARIGTLNTPKKIRVWVNKKYPEIMGCIFGEERLTDPGVLTGVHAPARRVFPGNNKSPKLLTDRLDEDVPF